MAETSTTWELKVNARAVGGLQKTLAKVFSKQTPREFNASVKDINTNLEVTVKRMSAIVTKLQQINAGASTWKRLAAEMRGASAEGQRLDRTLGKLHATNQRADRFARGGPGGGGGQGGGGGGGGGFGGGGGGIPKQLPMPGMGAIQTGLMSIPMAGMVAAGSLMAATQTYQSRLRFEQARLDAAPYLMRSRDVLSFSKLPETQRKKKQGGAGASGLTTAEAQMAFEVMREESLGEAGAMIGSVSQMGGVGKMAGKLVGRMLNSTPATAVGEIIGANSKGRRIAGDVAQINAAKLASFDEPSLIEGLGTDAQAREAELQRLADKSAYLEEHGISNAAMTVGRRKREGIKVEATTETVRSMPFDDIGIRNAGLRMGYNPAQAMQMAGQLSQAAGAPIGAADFEQALALQRSGISQAGQTGGTLKQLRYAQDVGRGGAGSNGGRAGWFRD